MRIPTTNIRKIIEAVGEAKPGDVLQAMIDDPTEFRVHTPHIIKKEYPHSIFTFETFFSEGGYWIYIYIRNNVKRGRYE